MTVRGVCPSCGLVVQTRSAPRFVTWRGPCPECGAHVYASRIIDPVPIPRRRPGPPRQPAISVPSPPASWPGPEDRASNRSLALMLPPTDLGARGQLGGAEGGVAEEHQDDDVTRGPRGWVARRKARTPRAPAAPRSLPYDFLGL